MKQYSYQRQKFNELLKQLQQEKVSGSLHVSSQIDIDDNAEYTLREHSLSSILAWKNGGLVYGNCKMIRPQEIAKQLLYKLNPKMATSALKFVITKAHPTTSAREYLSLLTRVKALKWEQIEASIQTQVVSLIEQISLYPGKARLDDSQNIELSFGQDEHCLDWSSLYRELKERQEKWETFAPEIPSPDAIPQAKSEKLITIDKESIREHIQQYIDGKRSLIEIANLLRKDPLNIARSYYGWVESGWISFEVNNSSHRSSHELAHTNSKPNYSQNVKDLPTILSVDDSLIVQASIKRALKDD